MLWNIADLRGLTSMFGGGDPPARLGQISEPWLRPVNAQ